MLKSIFSFVLLILSIQSITGSNGEKIELIIGGERPTTLNRFFYTIMPDDTLTFEVSSTNLDNIVVDCTSGNIIKNGLGKWKFIPPKLNGNYELIISDTLSGQKTKLTVFVLTPLSKKKGEYLEGYRIGNYPDENFKKKKNYTKPKGLIKVTKENEDIYLTPHFQLKQFLCKQSSGWPKFIIINPRLLVKLEYLLSELNKSGINANTLFVMSGYRTPYYNKLIGNVKFSRHVFGDAADIYVDKNLDGVIDDLNCDGNCDMSDAMIIHSIINKMEDNIENDHLIGGMGKYNKNSAHTYFIHVDTRGYKARW